MKSKFLLNIIVLLAIQTSTIQSTLEVEDQPQCYSWAIVGAGLAGITALAVLIDCGVEPATIAWIDPEFNVGRVGKYYRNVPGNVQASRLLLYVNNCPYFKDINPSSFAKLCACNLDEFQPLHVIADPLIDFTAYLANKVTAIKDSIASLDYSKDHWVLQGTDCTINAQKVILAIGAHPKELNYDIPVIPLDEAIDQDKLPTYVSPDDSIAVFGGMHSAILILKFLSECSVKQIINFYAEPYFYDAPGLEGVTALWAKNVLEQNPPSNLSRVLNSPENMARLLPMCNKVIYAIGYEPNPIIVNGTSHLLFDECSGVIAQDLYGIGIAFPPTGIVNGQKIAKNGLHAYLGYAKRLIPQWINNERFKEPMSCHEKNSNQALAWI
jgi:hypothetical protein